MIHYPNNGNLVQSLSELPNLVGCRDIILDFETTSGDDKIDSLNPWWNCDVAGVCITADDIPEAWYVPVGHRNPTPAEPNLDKSQVSNWLRDVLDGARCLTGQNIKYDTHVARNALGVDFRVYSLPLWDTLTQAKIVDSDRMSYSLDALSRDWLGEDISKYEAAFARYLYDGRGNQVCRDYGAVPALIMGEYGCQDVLTTRRLKQYIIEHTHPDCSLVSSNELRLTRELFDIECNGMLVDPHKVDVTKFKTLLRLTEIIFRIRDLTGLEIRPHTTDDCYRFLCGGYGLPVLEWTNDDDSKTSHKKSNPSFGKSAMAAYAFHPLVQRDPVLKECVELIQEYRTLNTFNSLFLTTFKNRNVNGVLHSSYNQMVRTARLSCSDPNAQQMSGLAKGLIEVPDEFVIMDIDLSQIEFRLIASTINNANVIRRYNESPTTDYHQLIADMAGLERKPAKNLNFAVGFGAGKKKAISMVKGSLDIASVGYSESGMSFDDYCQQRAEFMYRQYHGMLPELTPTMRKATEIARHRGYISNLYGRRRRLPVQACYKAFNNYIQSSAADIAKDLTLQIADYIRSLPDPSLARIIGVVHDSWIFYVHKSIALPFGSAVRRLIESVKPPREVRVPLLCDVATSDRNWKACGPDPCRGLGKHSKTWEI